MPFPYSRREFLSTVLKGAGGVAVAAAVPFSSGCGPVPRPLPGRYRFPQGLASGDPTPRSVVLWSRVEAVDGTSDPVEVVLQVAPGEDFGRLVVERTLTASASADHTLQVAVTGLEPDTQYHYRFLAGGDVTPVVGRTRTAPEPGIDRPMRLAVTGSQSWQHGDFGAWRTLIQEDMAAPQEDRIDLVLHLGSFVHQVLGVNDVRQALPFPSGGGEVRGGGRHAVTLEDHRHLYHTTLSDLDLQAARGRWPFIVMGDPHGIVAGDPPSGAQQAWSEFIPSLLPGRPGTPPPSGAAAPGEAGPRSAASGRNASPPLSRRFRFGRHVELAVLAPRSADLESGAGGGTDEGEPAGTPRGEATWTILGTPVPLLSLLGRVGAGEREELLRFIRMERPASLISLAAGPHPAGGLLILEGEDPDGAPVGVEFQVAGIRPAPVTGYEPAGQGVVRLLARRDRVEVELLGTEGPAVQRIRYTVRRGDGRGGWGVESPVLEGPAVSP